jgi:aspartate racemase
MEMEFFRRRIKESGIESIIPEKQATRDFIQHTLKEELGRGVIKEQTRRAYIEIINELIERGAEGIILGCTEIPLVISQQHVPVPVFDTTKIHSLAAVDFLLS